MADIDKKKKHGKPQDAPPAHPDRQQNTGDAQAKADADAKDQQLNQFRVDDSGQGLTTNTGLKVSEDEISLKAGTRGPTIMDDFHFREKMTHFDHERIPERIVHARGSGAHGIFEVTHDVSKFTKAKFLGEIGKQTPVFVRFSTVQGFRGSPDMVRDVRGFATKFYTEEGNFDLVGNNIPVFFINDAIKFPDFVHAVKPEPDHEMPQASSAHDTFWDYVVSNTELAHKLMWVLSDRGVPRSLRTMDGFGVNTFRWINAKGEAVFIKYHWRSVLGAHSVVWDEAQKMVGKNIDFHREDLWENIEKGNYPQYDLSVQILTEEDAAKLDFDILDDTKLIPEEIVPLTPVGRMTLNRNVDNFFAEVEQVAFHPGHIVPGMDFSNDPMLQGRLFSYTDTQLIRLGGPNFQQIPINRPIVPVHNNQRDGYMRMTINVGKTSYHKNSINANSPAPVSEEEGGFAHYQEKVEGQKIRAHSPSFDDHFTQATMFYRSQTAHEKQHLINAASFEIGKCKLPEIREKSVEVLSFIDQGLAAEVAERLGVAVPADKTVKDVQTYASLSQESTPKFIETKKVLVVATEGFRGAQIIKSLEDAGVTVDIMAEKLGKVKDEKGMEHDVKHNPMTGDAVLYDAFMALDCPPPKIPSKGEPGLADKVKTFSKETFMHFKPVYLGDQWQDSLPEDKLKEPGVLRLGSDGDAESNVLEILKQGRFWERNIDFMPQPEPNTLYPEGKQPKRPEKKSK